MIYTGEIQSIKNAHVAIIVSKFNRTITQRLLDGALAKFQETGVSEDQIDIFWVPGAFELPLTLEKILCKNKYIGAIVLGAVIRGETSHDQHINRTISHQFSRLSIRHQTPVMFGVLTCNTVEQAIARSGGSSTEENISDTENNDYRTLNNCESDSKDKSVAPHLGNKGRECAEALLEIINLFEKIDKI
ncbi:MAG: 6,7-dimethyl-8-ribityllumazine synthase [Planctomycetia bacterium]|nr:6,7-dimethyl-8-ribityllumazine synthase [Planctomycetia bacterium]